jgi:hypothetical protein
MYALREIHVHDHASTRYACHNRRLVSHRYRCISIDIDRYRRFKNIQVTFNRDCTPGHETFRGI